MTALQADIAQLSRLHSEHTAYVAVSPNELRQLFGQVENEFYRSKLYQKICGWLQRQLPGEDDLVSQLTGSLGKEAIRLTLRQLVSSASLSPSAKAAMTAPTEVDSTAQPTAEPKVNPVAVASAVTLTDAASPLPSITAPSKVANATHKAAGLDQPNPFALFSEDDAIAPDDITEHRQTVEQNIESSSFNQLNPAATLTDVGIVLQQVRQQAGLSLEQLHRMTHVPKRHIQAIEAGTSDGLPEDIYVRGFVRHLSYALGLDSSKLTCYESAIPSASPPNLEPKGQASLRHRQHRIQSASNSPSAHLRPAHLYTGYATLMLGALGSLFWVTWHQPVVDGGMSPPPPDTSSEEGDRSVWMPVSVGEGMAAKLRYFQLSKQQARQLGAIESIAVPELILNQLQTTQALESQ
ncbi:MAG: helix-turn-helix transcriptional regulator [Elainellaceae cyanobacterium]